MHEPEVTSTRTRERRPPARISPERLERQALYHLERYPTSVENLRRVLGRRASKSCDHHGDDRDAAEAMIASVIERLMARGLLDDRAYATALARRMRARGASRRHIQVRLHEKGVSSPLAEAALDAEGDADRADLAAAHRYARRRRIGPHRLDRADRAERRERDLAALGRAGFGWATALAVIDADPDDAPTP
jgi:regulatory protein